jgi:hypothetical protein
LRFHIDFAPSGQATRDQVVAGNHDAHTMNRLAEVRAEVLAIAGE